jgi:ATP-binding cassette subfamily B protein
MKQFFKKDLKNTWFLVAVCMKTAPLYTLWSMFEAIRNQVMIFIEHILAFQFVLTVVEEGRPFRNVAIFLLVLLVAEIVHLSVNAYFYSKYEPMNRPLVQAKLREKLFAKARELDLESFDNPTFFNDYVMAINESDTQLARALQTMGEFIGMTTRMILTGAFFIFLDAFSLIFVFGSFFLLFFLESAVNKLRFKIRLEKNPVERKLAYINRVFYLPDYAKELRLNRSMASRLRREHTEINDELQAIERKYTPRLTLLSWLKDYVFSGFIMSGVYMLYLVHAAVVVGRISFGSVAVFHNTARSMRNDLARVSRTVTDIADVSRYVERIHVFLDKKPQIISLDDLPVPTNTAEIEFKNVSFRYSENAPYSLRRVNMKIRAGEKVAIVGYNGAGKSTLVKLIMRLYDPTEGEILFGGVNIKNFNIEDYRRAIGVIFQDYKIFAATLRENVLLDIQGANVQPALSQAGFAERLATLPNGLEQQLTTEFEKDGVNLSGGEAQKVAIARAFHKDSPVIILDEPSSALDPIAEYHFNHAVTDVSGEKTMVFISHRLSTTRLADMIYLMENGEISESGNHAALLSRHGKYAEMWNAQTSRYLKHTA